MRINRNMQLENYVSQQLIKPDSTGTFEFTAFGSVASYNSCYY